MRLLTVPEVADTLRCARTTASELCATGAIRASKRAGRWLVAEDDLTTFIEAGYSAQPASAPTDRVSPASGVEQATAAPGEHRSLSRAAQVAS